MVVSEEVGGVVKTIPEWGPLCERRSACRVRETPGNKVWVRKKLSLAVAA